MIRVASALLLCLSLNCGSGEKKEETPLVEKGKEEEKQIDRTGEESLEIRQAPWLGRYDLHSQHPKQFKLPKRLSEISGLAMTDDGRLFCHQDETGMVFELDYATGRIVKQFSLGSGFLEEDFEGIAVKKDTFFLVSSSGDIFQFREAPDKSRSALQLHKTALSQKNDVEGLEYDPETGCLLLACRGDAGKGLGGYKAVYAYSLASKKLLDPPRFLIHINDVKEKSGHAGFHPSGIARHPRSGTFFIISADGHSIVELDTSGKILAQEEIPRKVNPQPEGITFAPDLSMILCNDGQGETGTLTVYPMKE